MPVIVEPANQLILSTHEILETIKNVNVEVVIIVHQYGIPVNVKKIRQCLPDVILIEDCAQLFYSEDETTCNIGKYCDILMTSFGNTKPLSLGVGGGVFSDNNLSDFANLDSVSSRSKSVTVYPYILPRTFEFNVEDLISRAQKTIQEQKSFAQFLIRKLDGVPVKFWEKDSENEYGISWHRFPIICKSKEDFDLLVRIADQYGIQYQLPHKETIELLPILKNHKYIFRRKKVKSLYLVRVSKVKTSTYQ